MAFVAASWGGGIWTSTVVVSLAGIVPLTGAKGSDDTGRSGWGGGRSVRCNWIWWSIVVCWFYWELISTICWKRVACVVDSVYKVAIRPWNSEAEMVMEGSDVVRATGGTVWVIGGAVETALGMGTCCAEVGDAGTSCIVSIGSSPYSVGTGVDYVCSVCGGSGGATMGWALRDAK